MQSINQPTNTVTSAWLWRTAAMDLAFVGGACLVPTLSHLTTLPLYQLNPMLLMLLASLLLVRGNRIGRIDLRSANALLLAVAMPVVSMVAVGMPTPAKALCMAAELTAVAGLYSLLEDRMPAQRWAHFGLMIAAIVAGKGVYYALKALLLAPAALVGTPLPVQALAALAAALLFALLLPKRRC